MKSTIKFQPFVGKSYHQNPFKILVLGESHYFGDEDLKAFIEGNTSKIGGVTQEVVLRFIAYKNGNGSFETWMNTFTRFSNLLSRKKLDDLETVEVWQNLAFYNFVQFPMGGPREAPTTEEFIKSEPAFKEVLKKLQPHLIIFWGHRLWNNFPKKAYYKKGNLHLLSYEYDYPIFVVPHPSSQPKNTNEKYEELKAYMKML
ncbi:uracil-DNA glycosylase [Riemerella anatipestifer]|uniref:uracil-DNA glycosylase family protein n=1 Tax=Riemerella anatipestifer TaxID=34085 RepID=UPI0030BB52A2